MKKIFISLIFTVLFTTIFLSCEENIVTDATDGDFVYSTVNNQIYITDYVGTDGEVTIPLQIDSKDVYCIDAGAFKNCTTITSILIQESVSIIGDEAFYGCTSLSSVSLPQSITSIGESAFSGCSSLLSVDDFGSLTEIEANAFYNCTSLSSIVLPCSLNRIGESAFENTALTSVAIPCAVVSISDRAFWVGSSLTSVTSNPVVPPVLGGENVFYNESGTTSLSEIEVPEDSLQSYKESDYWDEYEDLMPAIS